VTATAAANGQLERSATAQNTRTIGDHLASVTPENRKLKTHGLTSRAGSRTARKYSNATDCQRLRRTAADHLTCASHRERPWRQEFASRGSPVNVVCDDLNLPHADVVRPSCLLPA
jgi:hypothetical protein